MLKAKAQKESAVRSATNISSSDGAIDINDDDFAIGEIEEMSFGGGASFSYAAGTSGGAKTNKNRQTLVNIYAKYDILNTGVTLNL